MEKSLKQNTYVYILGFPGASVVKNLPAMQEPWVRSLDWEELLQKEMSTHSSILAWEIPWTEEPGGLQSIGSQYSCLGNPMDRGTWRASPSSHKRVGDDLATKQLNHFAVYLNLTQL